jgi:hypothetical protein
MTGGAIGGGMTGGSFARPTGKVTGGKRPSNPGSRSLMRFFKEGCVEKIPNQERRDYLSSVAVCLDA